MIQNDSGIRERYVECYKTWENTYNLEERLFKCLFSEVYNDLVSKKIKTLADWLNYYSTDTNNFSEVVKLVNSYYEKILGSRLDEVTFEEKLIGFNALVLWELEMDVELPRGNTSLQGTIMASFMEIIVNYDLVLKGYLSVKGDILISDRKQYTFYTEWIAGNIKKELPITLF